MGRRKGQRSCSESPRAARGPCRKRRVYPADTGQSGRAEGNPPRSRRTTSGRGPRQCVLAPTDWSADGRFVLSTFSGSFPATMDIGPFRSPGTETASSSTDWVRRESGNVFPQRQWIAYTSDEAGQPNVYLQPFLRAGGKHPISLNGGRNPHWRADGRELFYLDAAGTMTAVPIDLTASSPAGLPTRLFPAEAVSTNNMYAVTKDGQRFLVNRSQNSATTTPLTVIVNWTSTSRNNDAGAPPSEQTDGEVHFFLSRP